MTRSEFQELSRDIFYRLEDLTVEGSVELIKYDIAHEEIMKLVQKHVVDSLDLQADKLRDIKYPGGLS